MFWHFQVFAHVENVVEWRNDNLELLEEAALVDTKGQVMLYQEQIQLPEEYTVNKKSCRTPEGTWVWDDMSEGDKCRVFLTRKVTGMEIRFKWSPRLSTTTE